MSTGAVEYVFALIDRVTAPARTAQATLSNINKTLDLVTKATRISGAGFGGWAKQGEQAARKVDGAFERVQRRFEGMGQKLGELQNMWWNASFALAPIAGAGYAGKQIVDAAAYKQDTLINLKGMLGGNQGQASKLFADAVRFADITPFTTQQVIDATSQALAIGFTQKQAIPLVGLAGKLSAGSGKPMQQVMEAFAALRGGDFGEAFGTGQGFSQLHISRDTLRKAGLKFDKQGGYQGTVGQGLSAVRKIIESTYGSAMDEKSASLSGLASTIASRPQDLFMSLVNSKGQSQALASLQHFMSNVIDLTDFGADSGPGAKIRQHFQSSMTKLFTAIFHPLAQATTGDAGVNLINKLLDKLDQFSAWWSKNGPGITSNLKGFGEGLLTVAEGMGAVLKFIQPLLDKLLGTGGLGKLAGLAAGGFIGGKLLNTLSFGALGKVGGFGLRLAGGALKGGVQGLLTRGVLGEVLTHPGGLLKGISSVLTSGGPKILGFLARIGPMFLRILPWLGRIGAFFLELSNPLGWIIGIGAAFTGLYEGFKPFHDFVDSLADKFREAGRWALDLGKNLLMSFAGFWDKLSTPVRLILGALIPGLNVTAGNGLFLSQNAAGGAVPAVPNSGNRSVAAVTAVANQLGINPADLLPVIFRESGLNPAAWNATSHAVGLMQFLPSTAKAYGLTPEQFRNMTPEQQVPYMARYLKGAGIHQGSSMEEIYSAIFSGHAANALKNGGVQYRAGSQGYKDNAAMDLNGDRVITSAELTASARKHWAAAKGQFAPSVTVNNYGPVTKEGLQALGDQTSQVLAAQAREHGHGVTP